jgi:hypothetical protein
MVFQNQTVFFSVDHKWVYTWKTHILRPITNHKHGVHFENCGKYIQYHVHCVH